MLVSIIMLSGRKKRDYGQSILNRQNSSTLSRERAGARDDEHSHLSRMVFVL
jgi:hypothetical protein